jgi:hypothetical protein
LLTGRTRCVEIECHPNSRNDFDTLFLDSPELTDIVKNHHITNFSNL